MQQKELELDALDRELLDRIAKNPGASIAEVARPFLKTLSESAIRRRIMTYELHDMVKITRTRHERHCFIADSKAAKVAGHGR